MTIKKGEPWGEPGSLSADGVLARTDRDVSRALEQARAENAAFPSFGLLGGDLCRTLGGTGALGTTYPVDVGEALIDGRHHYFVAHLVAHDRWWRRAAVAMNAQWLDDWNLGPRAHPNDGAIDTYRAELSITDRVKVRPRLATGSHLPHPGITAERGAAVTIELHRALPVYVDGELVGRGSTLAIRVLPDALRVVA